MADKKSREVVGTGQTDHGQHYVEYSDGTKEAVISGEGCGRDVCYRDCTGECRKDSGKTVGEISVKVDVDVSEALTGLKAVQREAREAAKALAELKAEQERDGLASINDFRNIQGKQGNYDYSEYMRGMYNGLELASATLERRDPEYK